MLRLVLLVVVLVFAFLIAKRVVHYRRLFAPEHFREVHVAFAKLVEASGWASLGVGAGADGAASRAPDALVTSAGLAIAVTATLADTQKVLHVSLSQAGRATIAAVAHRFGFFVVTMLNRNVLSLDPYFTETRVHHLRFEGDTLALAVNDFDSTWEIYLTQYRPLPFTFRAQAT